MSSPINNRIVYTAPSIASLFNTPLSSFESFDQINMQLSVQTTVMSYDLGCVPARNCFVSYSWDYTPIIHYVTPPIVYPGMAVSVGVDPQWAPDYKKEGQPPIDVRIDGVGLNFTETYDEESNLNKKKLNWATGTVNNDIRNSSADVTAFFRGAGYAMEDTTTLPTYLFDGSSYTVKVMPTVSSVSHDQGYAEGSQTLTITGTSLDSSNVAVTVDDVTCDVVSSSETQIVCKTGKKAIDSNAQSPAVYIGQQGLTRYIFNETNTFHEDWRDHIDDKLTGKDLWPNLEYIHDVGVNRLKYGMMAWVGYF